LPVVVDPNILERHNIEAVRFETLDIRFDEGIRRGKIQWNGL
jgi:hypothetical protein